MAIDCFNANVFKVNVFLSYSSVFAVFRTDMQLFVADMPLFHVFGQISVADQAARRGAGGGT